MFDISATELLVIAVVAIVVIGPKDLPDMLKGLGRFLRKMRLMAGDFQRQLDQAGFEDVRKGIEEVRSLTSPSGVIARSIASSIETDDSKRTIEQKASAEPAAAQVSVETKENVPSVDTTIAKVSISTEDTAIGTSSSDATLQDRPHQSTTEMMPTTDKVEGDLIGSPATDNTTASSRA
ncbi:sec-independent protein translocase protein TatB [Rhodoligotrophos appendicifer]|uniref:Sec-independent protein translocase protein TatB n=1 Tax=Rhodoligotrophos appendicifer TaxID=987056 RepID=UPI001186D060|nr:Sec-independent protein translocase protein TatB [Rhodoligotrophos appendicifer]